MSLTPTGARMDFKIELEAEKYDDIEVFIDKFFLKVEAIWKLSKKATEYLNRVNWKAIKDQAGENSKRDNRRLNLMEESS